MSLLTRFHKYTFTRIYKNFVNGEFVEPKDTQRYPVRNPVTQELLGYVPQTSQEEFNAIIENSKVAFKTWSKTPLLSTIFIKI
jgi:malonate-semialdehyde dehydrogenase (acetylating)/methylmalonate-semialdehyde dehydrogenase